MKHRYMLSCAVAALLGGYAGSAAAAAAAAATTDASSTATGVEEIVVTAERRDESIQKVPMTVQAYSGETLQQLNIQNLNDALHFLPNVTYGGTGPGQGSIFMRGLSSGQAGNQSSSTAGNFPNVAVYLDDQSMQFPGRNVDIYLADMSRLEVDEGPQGVLFGGGAEAGALRYITNKPDLTKVSAYAEAGYGFTAHGAADNEEQVVLNIPIIKDKFGIRAVVYNDRQGGYIDNVASTFTPNNSDLGNYYFNIHPGANGLCPNGQPGGATGYCTLPTRSGINNYALARNAQNPTTTQGVRAEALWDINNDWSLLISESYQNLDAEGSSYAYPQSLDFQPLQPLQTTQFSPSYDIDRFENTAWTLKGKIDGLSLIYTGAYMVRNIHQQQDYTNYSRTGGGIYYECTGGTNGLFGPGTTPTCYSPAAYWEDTVRNTHWTNEIRVTTPDDKRIRFLGGLYYEQFKIYDVMNFDYKSVPACNAANLANALAGGLPCVADTRTAVGSTASQPGIRADNVGFGEDVQRGYDQFAAFGSVDVDVIPNKLTISGGTRYYNYSEYEVGSEYYTDTSCVNVPNGQCGGPTGAGGYSNIDSHHDHVNYHGFKSRATVNWHITDDTLAYFLFSQGFRPGGFNRTTGAVAPGPNGQAQFEKPNGYSPDDLTNYEIGLKTQLFDHRLQLNLSAYMMDWDNVQFAFFNPQELGNTTFLTNGPNFNIKGVEGQFVAKPFEGLTVQGSASYNHNVQSNNPALLDNIPGTPAFGQPITQILIKGIGVTQIQNLFGAPGAVAPFSPTFQGNIRVRYEHPVGAMTAYGQVAATYTGSEYNVPATYPSGTNVLIPGTTTLRYLIPGYATVDASVGLNTERWSVSVNASNLFNNEKSTFITSAEFVKATIPLVPRVVMMKVSAKF
jgi:outer membrane receptor protein involved in Fe transport